MTRITKGISTALALLLAVEGARADFGCLHHGGCQHHGGCHPWSHICAKHKKKKGCCEEQRLNGFWHDYYDAQGRYYGMLSNLDWVSYYKNHGYQINQDAPCGGPCRIQYAPVVITPSMQWAAPYANGCMDVFCSPQ
jgi:hypothetical protein